MVLDVGTIHLEFTFVQFNINSYLKQLILCTREYLIDTYILIIAKHGSSARDSDDLPLNISKNLDTQRIIDANRKIKYCLHEKYLAKKRFNFAESVQELTNLISNNGGYTEEIENLNRHDDSVVVENGSEWAAAVV